VWARKHISTLTELEEGSLHGPLYVTTLALKKCEDENSQSQVSSHVGSWSLTGFLNFQKTIAKVKTPRSEELFITLESYGSVDV
jgi:hypothetical protein